MTTSDPKTRDLMPPASGEHYSTGETCVIHASCSGAEDDCRTERGTRPRSEQDAEQEPVTIHYVVYQSHLDGDGSTTDEQADGYAANVERAIQEAYPNAEVEIEVRRHVQGVGSGLQGEPEGVDPGLIRYIAEQAEIPG
jgi:hypothetical protein